MSIHLRIHDLGLTRFGLDTSSKNHLPDSTFIQQNHHSMLVSFGFPLDTLVAWSKTLPPHLFLLGVLLAFFRLHVWLLNCFWRFPFRRFPLVPLLPGQRGQAWLQCLELLRAGARVRFRRFFFPRRGEAEKNAWGLALRWKTLFVLKGPCSCHFPC